MSNSLESDDVRRRAAVVGVALDQPRAAGVVALVTPVNAALPQALQGVPFEAEPSSFMVVLADGVRR